MNNLSRYDRRYAALWLPLTGGLLAGFALLAMLVIGVLAVAGLGLANSAIGAWEHFGPRAAGLPQLLVGLVFAPLVALVAALLVVGGVMTVLVRLIAFENNRAPSARAWNAEWPGFWPGIGGSWTQAEDIPASAGPEPANPSGDQDAHSTGNRADPGHA